jgi:hypothetical protein
MHNKSAAGKRELIEYYNIPEWCQRQFIRDYPGFNINTEGKEFCQRTGINVRFYAYAPLKNQYYLSHELEYEGNTHVMNLLVTMWQGKEHVTLITNVDRLTGLLICPKCGECVAKRDRPHYDKVFTDHVERCTGKRRKEVRVLYREQPYVPHIMKNPKMIEHLINNTVLEPLNE